MPLTMILAMSLDRKIQLKKSLHKSTSVSEDELDNAMNKDELGKELEPVIDVLNLSLVVVPWLPSIFPAALNKMKKLEMIRKLIVL